MSQTQKYLPQSNGQEKPKSQNGGSTNLSQGSNQVDEEFKVKQGENFQFINETVNEWPQWSVEQQQKEKDQAKTSEELKALEQKIQLQLDTQFMFNRGMSLPLRMKILENRQRQRKQEQSKKSFVKGVVDKIKGWFK